MVWYTLGANNPAVKGYTLFVNPRCKIIRNNLDISLIVIFSVVMLSTSMYLKNQKSDDEIIQEKIAIIEQSQRTPTPETLAIAEIAKVELAEIQTKKQEQQDFAKKSDVFGSREFWIKYSVIVISLMSILFILAIVRYLQ